MTLQTPVLNQNGTYDAVDLRRLVKAYPYVGVVGADDLKVTQRGTGTDMSVDVAAGIVILENSTATRGRYVCESDAVTNLAIAAHPSTGSSRIDLVVAGPVADSQYSGVADSWPLSVVTGTPGASPAAPATPAGAIVLARVAVSSTTAYVTDAQITDYRRHARQTVYTDTVPVAVVNGQTIIGSDGVKRYGAGGVWVVEPHPSQTAAGSTSVDTVTAPGTLTGSYVAKGTTTITRPVAGRPVTVLARFAGTIAATASTGAITCYMSISLDGGSTWHDGPGVRGTSGSTVTAVPVANAYTYTGTPTGNIVARLMAKNYTGSVDLSGIVDVLVIPA